MKYDGDAPKQLGVHVRLGQFAVEVAAVAGELSGKPGHRLPVVLHPLPYGIAYMGFLLRHRSGLRIKKACLVRCSLTLEGGSGKPTHA